MFVAIWVGDRYARSLAARVEDRELRLLALRREAEAASGNSGVRQDLLVPKPQEESGLTFYVVCDDGVHEVEIFLDERLMNALVEHEPATWQGVIEYIESDLQNGGV